MLIKNLFILLLIIFPTRIFCQISSGSNLSMADDNGEFNSMDTAEMASNAKTLKAQELSFTPTNGGRYGGKMNNWYKGNTHSHPTAQIGLNETGKLYHDNDFDFLVLTEHTTWYDSTSIQFSPRRSNFLIIPGEEYDSGPFGYRHTSVLNSTQRVGALAGGASNHSEYYNQVYTAVSAAAGMAIINHPVWIGVVTPDEHLQIQGIEHMELFNGAQDTDNYGLFGGRDNFAIWDTVLTGGKKLYGVASDDFHNATPAASSSSPFTGWTMLKTSDLSIDSVMYAFRVGQFYGSNGVILEDYTTDLGLIKVKIDSASTLYELGRRDAGQWATSARPVMTGNPGYRIDFIGENGTLLKSTIGIEAEYQVQRTDSYVRVQATYLRMKNPGDAPYINFMNQATYVTNNNITKEEYYAWTQPFFTDIRHEGGTVTFGCTDSNYLEFNPNANISVPDECKTLHVFIKQNHNFKIEGGRRLSIEIGGNFGDYEIEIRNISGEVISQINSNFTGVHEVNNLISFRTYIIIIKGENQIISKRILMY